MARSSLIKTGLWVALMSLLAGVTSSAIGMYRVGYDLASQDTIDAQSVSKSVGMAMIWTIAALPFVALGIAICIAGLFMAPKRNQATTHTSDVSDASAEIHDL